MNKTLETACNNLLTDLYNQLIILQPKYKDEELSEDIFDDKGSKIGTKNYIRKKYFQLLETHSVIPADGITVTEDVNGKTPTDQKETYTDFGLVLPAKMPCSISVSPYEDNRGWGFELIGKVVDGADTYMRVMNYGH